MTEGTKDAYQAELGRRLRGVRQQKKLTLQQVEEASGGKWKAVVIGAYERGDRAISAAKLVDLADFYDVPVAELLPSPHPDDLDEGAVDVHVSLDLTQLNGGGDPAIESVARWASTIQRQRGDYNGRVLTLRGDDVRALSVAVGLGTEEFMHQLAERGVLADPDDTTPRPGLGKAG
jgi:transcriptional regulator with XRE-family HTH domain